jgi:hypothetical protein
MDDVEEEVFDSFASTSIVHIERLVLLGLLNFHIPALKSSTSTIINIIIKMGDDVEPPPLVPFYVDDGVLYFACVTEDHNILSLFIHFTVH